jgi:predicted metal-dependent hydrolase
MASDSIMMEPTNKPLSWKLRVSRRVKYARLQIKPYSGLEVIIPPRFPRAAVSGFVEEHIDWIQTQLARYAELHPKPKLPERVFLALDGSDILISYPGQLEVSDLFSEYLQLPSADIMRSITTLRQWVRAKAMDLLPERLLSLSSQTGLECQRISIRSQKSRWGSCSSKGTISLNDQLVFLPPACVDYLIIHELCHTQHMNHSQAFWRLVEHHCPDFQVQENALNNPQQWVPNWFTWDLHR